MRLDKYISQITDYSRKEVKRLLKLGAITIDGETTKDPALHINEEQVVALDGDHSASPDRDTL